MRVLLLLLAAFSSAAADCTYVFYSKVTPATTVIYKKMFKEPICNMPEIPEERLATMKPMDESSWYKATAVRHLTYTPYRMVNMTCRLNGRTVCRAGRYMYVINNEKQPFDARTLKSLVRDIHMNTQLGDTDFNITVETPLDGFLSPDMVAKIPLPFTRTMIEDDHLPVTVECTPISNAVLESLNFEDILYECHLKVMTLKRSVQGVRELIEAIRAKRRLRRHIHFVPAKGHLKPRVIKWKHRSARKATGACHLPHKLNATLATAAAA